MINEGHEIAVRIRGLREASGHSCQEVATETGVTLATYMRYETGAEDAPLSYLPVLAAFYKVEVTALLTGGRRARTDVPCDAQGRRSGGRAAARLPL